MVPVPTHLDTYQTEAQCRFCCFISLPLDKCQSQGEVSYFVGKELLKLNLKLCLVPKVVPLQLRMSSLMSSLIILCLFCVFLLKLLVQATFSHWHCFESIDLVLSLVKTPTIPNHIKNELLHFLV